MCSMSWGRRRGEAGSPALLWLRPGRPHSYGPDTAAGWTESWLLFEGPFHHQLRGAGLLACGCGRAAGGRSLPLILVMMRLADTCRNAETDMDVVAASLVDEFLVTSKRVVRQPGNDERLLDGLRTMPSAT